MSTAVLEPIVEQTTAIEPAELNFVAPTPAPPVAEVKWADPHPLLPVFIAGAISAVLAGTFIGSILVWLAVRHSGVMAP